MSCDFELKMVVSYIDRRSMYTKADRKKGIKTKEIEFSTRWLSQIFKNVGFWPPEFQKNKFFWEKCSKIQNFQIKKKNVLYV